MMKAYLIPGSGEGLKDRDYQAVLDVYKNLGYEPKFVKIEWRYKTIDDWVEQIKVKISKKDLQNSLLSGFSYGSMIAFTVAAKYANPKKLLLFSLSPYFKEDFPIPEDWQKWAGKRKIENFKKLSFNEMAPKIDCQTILFIGDKELKKYGDKRDREAKKRIKASRYIIVSGVGHDVGDPLYVKAIKDSLSV